MKKLRRSTTDRKIAGVAGGLGEYFNLDPILFRIVFVIIALPGGVSIIIYFVLWLIMPLASSPKTNSTGSDVIDV